jgi:hypothetical protein
VIQCQICQVANEDIAQFCKECGGRLTPAKPLITNPSPLQQAPVQQAAAPAEPQTQPKPKLRSPLFGGGSDADNNFDDDEEVQPSLNKAKGKGLRSPLLGGADEDEEPAFEPKPRDAKSRGALRSPMFGGGGGDGGKNKEHKSTFPHRSHDVEAEHEPSPAAKLEPGRHQSKGLRSPLLGGDDFDPEAGLEEEPGMHGKAGGQVKAHHRLRSPILGATDDGYEDEIFDEEVDDVDDPTVLRSPLLAVKTPRAKPAPAPAPAPAPVPTQAMPAPAPAPMPVQAMPTAMPLQQAPAPYPAVPQAFAPNSPSSPPAAPTSAPQYEPRPAPSPSNSQFGMAAQNPSHYDYGVSANSAAPVSMPAPVPAPMPAPAPQSVQPAPSPAPSPSAVSDSDSGVKKGMRGSKLLGSSGNGDDDDDELLGPQDRRNKSRERRMSRPDRRSSSSIDIDDDDDALAPSIRRGSSGAGGGANPMAPLLMAAAAFALIVKAYVFIPLLGNPDLFTKNMPYVLEQVSTMAVLLSLIMYAMKASQKP